MLKKLLVFTFIVMLSLMGCSDCNAQPISTYQATWTANPAADSVTSYKTFVWEGGTAASCPLVQGMDYTTLDTTAVSIMDVKSPSFTFKQDNNGNYLVVGVVAINSQNVYSGMRVSSTLKKATVPTVPAAITLIRIK